MTFPRKMADTTEQAMHILVSQVNAHGRLTITPRFSVYWALTWDTGCLPCVKIEIGGADCSQQLSTYACM